MSEFKYLSDGRKVQIVGKLNNVEYIVQEIFVTAAGDEVPSGERFTTKSLHDAPVISYYKKEEERAKQSLERVKKEINGAHDRLRELEIKQAALKSVYSSAFKAVKDTNNADLQILFDFLEGNIKWVVELGYSLNEPIPFMDFITTREYNRFESVRLISLFGRSDGALNWRMSQYSDPSGSYWKECKFFKTHEEAVNCVQEIALFRLEEGKLTNEEIRLCIKLGIKLPYEKTAALIIERKAKQEQSTRAQAEKTNAEAHAKAEEYNKLLEALA
jgi:hypothetical protein